jgi:hypothetical protein
MAFSQSGKIEASDINGLITSINSTLTSLGQTNLSSVSQYDKITADKWQSLITTTTNLASHQNTVTSTLPTITVGQKANYYSTVSNAITLVNANKKNAVAQGTTVTNYTEASATWSDKITFTQSVSFANATAATNFFNAGGQIALQFLHPANTQGIDIVFNTLGTDCGTIALSGHNSGNATIAGTVFTGITKVGGGGNTPTISTNLGYAGLTTTPQSIFKQLGGSYISTGLNPRYQHAPISYNQNYIEVKAYLTNNGTTINFETAWDEVPNGLLTGSGNVNGRTKTTTYVLIKYPSTTYIANSWSSLSFTGSVSGS